MAQPSPLSVLSGALKIADKVTVALEAVGNKIRVNSQGWEDARVIGERQISHSISRALDSQHRRNALSEATRHMLRMHASSAARSATMPLSREGRLGRDGGNSVARILAPCSGWSSQDNTVADNC